MSERLSGRRVAILAADGVERVELVQSRDALRSAGADTDLLSIKQGRVKARDHDLEPAQLDRLLTWAPKGWSDHLDCVLEVIDEVSALRAGR